MCVFVCFPSFFLCLGLGRVIVVSCCYLFHTLCVFFLKCFFCIIDVLRVHRRGAAHFHDEFQCPVNSCTLRSLDVAEKSFAKSEPKGMMADDGWL